MNFEVAEAVEILSKTPETLGCFIGKLSPEWFMFSPSGEEWNAFDVIGHLIHCEKTDWIPRAALILSKGDNVTFEPFDRFAQATESKGKSLDDLLGEFSRLRAENVEKLLSWKLNADDLCLRGIHPEFGEVTLAQLLSTWVVHDLTHIRQIANTLARRYTNDVGPWKQYLSILK